MVRVTTHYGISGPVPFVDVHADRDNALFLDPSAIRNSTNRWAAPANAKLQTFFTEVVKNARSSTPADQRRGRELLSHLHEPNETRLGLSSVGSRGRAFGNELETQLWDELRSNPACQHAVLTRLEDTRLFIDMVGDDRISDMTTRIVFDVLADFTTAMMAKYPSLTAGQTLKRSEFWDETALKWGSAGFKLPTCFGQQLLLVPREWVYWRTLMAPIPFYNRYGTEVIREERTVLLSNGRRRGPSKRQIKEENPQIRKVNNEKSVEYKRDHGRDLVAEYRSWVDQEFEPLSDAEIVRRTP